LTVNSVEVGKITVLPSGAMTGFLVISLSPGTNLGAA